MYNDLLNKLEILNSECFIYDNYESNWWSLLDLDFDSAMNIKNIMNAVEKYAVGYCDSSRVKLRPKKDSYAVMFEKDGKRFWFHIPKWEFEYEDCV